MTRTPERPDGRQARRSPPSAPSAARAAAAAALILAAGLATSGCRSIDPADFGGTLGATRYTAAELAAYGIDEDVVVSVRLPAGYDPAASRTWPVAFVLDGDSLFPKAAAAAAELERAADASALIVVGLGYGYPDSYSAAPRKGRWRDMSFPDSEGRLGPVETGNGLGYYRFVTEKVVPAITAAYRTDPARTALVGHSRGGSFVWYALCAYDPATPSATPFSHFISGDGGQENYTLAVHLPAFLERMRAAGTGMARPVHVYDVWGYLTNPAGVVVQERRNDRVAAAGIANLTVERFVPRHDDHGDTMQTTIDNGFRLLVGHPGGYATGGASWQ